MKKYRLLSGAFWVLAWLTSCVLCAVVASDWTYLANCPICSAPPYAALVNLVLYVPVCLICAGLAIFFGRKKIEEPSGDFPA